MNNIIPQTQINLVLFSTPGTLIIDGWTEKNTFLGIDHKCTTILSMHDVNVLSTPINYRLTNFVNNKASPLKICIY